MQFKEIDGNGRATELQENSAPPGATGKRQVPILSLWAVCIVCVIVGELAPGASPLMGAVGRLHINDKVLHFGAYLLLSSLPVIGFGNRRRGIVMGLWMFVLGLLLEGAQHFSPGRSVEFGDVAANGAGVGCGLLLAPYISRLIALL